MMWLRCAGDRVSIGSIDYEVTEASTDYCGFVDKRRGSGSVVVFVSATVTAVPGFNSKVTVTFMPFTLTSTGNETGAGLSSSGMGESLAQADGGSRGDGLPPGLDLPAL